MSLRVMSGVLAVVFLACVALQYNDPDPLQWMAIYGAACILAAFGAARPERLHWAIPTIVGGIAVVWALTLVPGVIGRIGFSDLFRTMKAETPAIEESREALGLLIIGVWMTVVAIASKQARSRR